MTLAESRYREPATLPHGLPAVRPAADVEVSGAGAIRAAMQAAAAAMEVAEQLGLPEPLHIGMAGGRVEARLVWPDLLRWMGMLRGLRIAGDGHGHGHTVHGWTETTAAGGRRQQWVLRPVAEYDCRRCAELPDTYRQPLSPTAWRDDLWWRLVGKRWEEPTGPRAHLLAAARRPSPRRRTADR